MFGMFEILKDEFQMDIYDADGIQEYVKLGYITQDQADEITGKNSNANVQSNVNQPASSANSQSNLAESDNSQSVRSSQKAEPSPNENILNSEVQSNSNIDSNASN